jgi:hypothetical protein
MAELCPCWRRARRDGSRVVPLSVESRDDPSALFFVLLIGKTADTFPGSTLGRGLSRVSADGHPPIFAELRQPLTSYSNLPRRTGSSQTTWPAVERKRRWGRAAGGAGLSNLQKSKPCRSPRFGGGRLRAREQRYFVTLFSASESKSSSVRWHTICAVSLVCE